MSETESATCDLNASCALPANVVNFSNKEPARQGLPNYALIGIKDPLLFECLPSKLGPFPEPRWPLVRPRLAQDTLVYLLPHSLHALPGEKKKSHACLSNKG